MRREQYKNFVISGEKQVKMFVNAIEESAQNRPVHIPVAANEITDEAELVEFMAKWEQASSSSLRFFMSEESGC